MEVKVKFKEEKNNCSIVGIYESHKRMYQEQFSGFATCIESLDDFLERCNNHWGSPLIKWIVQKNANQANKDIILEFSAIFKTNNKGKTTIRIVSIESNDSQKCETFWTKIYSNNVQKGKSLIKKSEEYAKEYRDQVNKNAFIAAKELVWKDDINRMKNYLIGELFEVAEHKHCLNVKVGASSSSNVDVYQSDNKITFQTKKEVTKEQLVKIMNVLKETK